MEKHFDKVEIERFKQSSLNQIKEMIAAGEISPSHTEEIMTHIAYRRKTVLDKPF